MKLNHIKSYSIFFLGALLFLLSITGAYALVYIQTNSSQLQGCANYNIKVNVSLSGVSNLYGIQFNLSYNSSIFSFVSLTEGGFLSANGYNETFLNYTNTSGVIRNVIISKTGMVNAVGSSGVLAVIVFRVRNQIDSSIITNFTLKNVKLSDINLNALDNSKQNGSTTIVACACTNGATQPCIAPNTCSGTRTCVAGTWGSCVTNLNYCDNNCDGTNEICTANACTTCNCIGYGSQDCITQIGNCPGIQACSSGQWGACVIRGYYCDTDCNGANDTCSLTACTVCACASGTTQPCGPGNVGECRNGTRTCTSGQWGVCVGNVSATTETCDGKDNDCNNVIDNGFPNKGSACSVGVGACNRTNVYICNSGGTGTVCNATAGPPVAETCNNIDDNCNNLIDDNVRESCYSGASGTLNVGLCRNGSRTCTTGNWGSCVGEVIPTAERCDGLDNDCTSGVDNGFPNKGQACTVGVGACARTGTYICSVNGLSTVCSVTAGSPALETCNGQDDDCDGFTDNIAGQSCYSGSAATRGVGVCHNGTRTCSGGNWGTCVGEVIPGAETCDGLDNNCDGATDESCSCISGQARSCGSNVGECSNGTQTCSGGNWGGCIGEVGPATELCDNDDDDCNGMIDDNLQRLTANQNGLCNGNNERCSSGAWAANSTNYAPQTEDCDGWDNNCDGSVDENLKRLSVNQNGSCANNTDICAGGNWVANSSNYVPQADVCDNADNNCNGQVDEGCTCVDGTSRNCSAPNTCSGNQSCSGGTWSSCVTTKYHCDSDCDGDLECVDQNCAACACVENWDCTGWSSCSGGWRDRSCVDLNDCGTTNLRPDLVQACSSGGSGGGGSGGGGGGSGGLSSCVANWTCATWGACEPDGRRRRVCTDSKNCGTTATKPNELETCLYQGDCQDGVMNGDEQGIDCGGRCPVNCSETVIDNAPQLGVIVSPINAEVLDNYLLEISIENQGGSEVKDLDIAASKWSDEKAHIDSISPEIAEHRKIWLSLPGDPNENSLEIQVSQEGSIVATKTVAVSLSVPQFNFKLGRDPKTGQVYQAVLIDNRNKPARDVSVDYNVNKGKETYLFETDKAYDVPANELFQRVDYLRQDLPAGEYEVKSALFEQGEQVDQATSFVTLSGGKGFNVSYLFYFLMLVIIGVSGYVFFMSQKK